MSLLRKLSTIVSLLAFLMAGFSLNPAFANKAGLIQKVNPAQKAFAKIQDLLKYSYREKTIQIHVPGVRIKTTTIHWAALPKSFPRSVVSVLQTSSLNRITYYADHSYKTGWHRLRRWSYKRIAIKGVKWWVFSQHRYSANKLYAYNPKNDALFGAFGMYGRGGMPALLRVYKFRLYAKLFRELRFGKWKRKALPSLVLALKKKKFQLKNPVNWTTLPKTMEVAAVNILLPGFRGQKIKRKGKKTSLRISSIGFVTPLFHKGVRWLFFVEVGHHANKNRYLFQPSSRILYTAFAAYRGTFTTYTIRGPFKVPEKVFIPKVHHR